MNWRKNLQALQDQSVELLPHSLLGRSILIIVTPIILLQILLAWIFYDSHWDTVTKRLAQSVAGDIATVIDLLPEPMENTKAQEIFTIAAQKMGLKLVYSPQEILPNDPTVTRQNLVDRRLSSALEDRVARPFIIDSRSLEKQIEIHVQLADGVLHVTVPRRRLFTSTTYVFFLWMVGISLALLVAATLFMRNQVRPIKRLAQAADEFGKGIDSGDFTPWGAREVALAGHAFNQMRNRIRRQISQRTEMLAGVSHDLRTPLTRMNLQLAMLGASEDIAGLKKDVADMERMIEGYLAFARGEGTEQPQKADIGELIDEAVQDAKRHGANIEIETLAHASLLLKKDAMRRCLQNIIGNAQNYAHTIRVNAEKDDDILAIHIDDDGPGIPEDRREDVFRPFFRLDESRNTETGGTGLGLTIARDIMRSHGGDLTLDHSPLGGLRASLMLPV